MESKHKLSINQWALEDRPREKMMEKGAAALSSEPGPADPRLCRRGALPFPGRTDQKQAEHEGLLAGYARPFHAG